MWESCGWRWRNGRSTGSGAPSSTSSSLASAPPSLTRALTSTLLGVFQQTATGGQYNWLLQRARLWHYPSLFSVQTLSLQCITIKKLPLQGGGATNLHLPCPPCLAFFLDLLLFRVSSQHWSTSAGEENFTESSAGRQRPLQSCSNFLSALAFFWLTGRQHINQATKLCQPILVQLK